MKSVRTALALLTLGGAAFAQTSATGAAGSNTSTQTSTPYGTAAAQGTSQTSAAAQSGAVIPIELAKSIDSKKVKVGDEVTAKVISDVRSGGAVAIPRGSKLLGKVTEANARSKGDATSSLGITFDRAVLKNGSTLNLISTVQAVIAPPQAPPPAMGDTSGGGAATPSGGGGDIIGGATGAVGNAAGSALGGVGNTAGSAIGNAGADVNAGGSVGANAPVLTARTTGVVGIKGLELNAAGNSQTSGSVFTTSSKSVKLDSGTRMLINVSAASPGSAQTAEESKK